MSTFRSLLASTAIISMAALSPFTGKLLAADEEKDIDRLQTAATVFSEVMAAPDKGIPQDLLENAHCIVIVPGLKKGAFIVGAKFGKGFVSCRDERAGRHWSAPGAVRVEARFKDEARVVGMLNFLSVPTNVRLISSSEH